jgi:hypothetical protein
LRAYHIGPRAVRIRRGDLTTLLTPLTEGPVAPANQTELRLVHTSSRTIRPLTDEQVRQARDALAASQELIARQRAMRGGRPFDESWPMIRAAREERSKQLL